METTNTTAAPDSATVMPPAVSRALQESRTIPGQLDALSREVCLAFRTIDPSITEVWVMHEPEVLGEARVTGILLRRGGVAGGQL